VAAEAHAVTTRTSREEVYPPAWAEAVLRALVGPRNRDTITGDLLEEYREVIVPARSRFGARTWYVRQVVSFVSLGGLIRALRGGLREDAMFDRLADKSMFWLVAGGFAFTALLGALVRSSFGPPASLSVFVVLSVTLGISAAISKWSRADIQRVLRIALACGILMTLVLLVRLLVEVFDPVDPVERFLARARDDYSEFSYPRRWVPAAAVALIMIGGGLRGAWRTARVGMGTMAALAASVIGSLVYVTLVALGNTLPLGPQDPLGNSPRDLQFFGNIPSMLIPVLAMLGTVLGTIGALFGRALAATKN
jgi:hypothetical protein